MPTTTRLIHKMHSKIKHHKQCPQRVFNKYIIDIAKTKHTDLTNVINDSKFSYI